MVLSLACEFSYAPRRPLQRMEHPAHGSFSPTPWLPLRPCISHLDCRSNWSFFHQYILHTASKVTQISKLILKPFYPSATKPSLNSYRVYKATRIWSLSSLTIAFATTPPLYNLGEARPSHAPLLLHLLCCSSRGTQP